ncbi:Ribosomal RNA large subunit methyltransferase H [Acholeplasma oculi]|uniref:Ribosomal RNA large subunit methyltransferase H n=1 Tax=Acholeplasma oculi TaxID=35623 RepID=A0A061AJZ5_9MOLU|nr:23S rRNA (pseudouridine(1915)-N(3))-methyltransferase RlmH [Acholeplasma oculi]CDR31327.1 Ribosomal RNA large subunit methyltransferase H [Acholeplasma oculi]SKC39047.1 23S rRNA (pseudouridine1915-N3)-methyltransferase [Acholeplasma oculi]SUT91637.1 Ribosomal RNA large subunit methyltransferase H [Acholeplasma oculi]
MKIKIICVGYLKQKPLNDLIADYKKQIKDITILEIPDEKELQGMKKEGEQILNKISKDEYVIALAIEGKKMTSEAFASVLDKVTTFQTPQITFIIGGSFGLSDEVKERSNMLLSFSDFTFPHQLMRLMLIEQIYRAISILKNHPYHK